MNAFGAEVAGSASLEDFARFAVNADLRHFELQTVVHGYSGSASGHIVANGDLHASGAGSLQAKANLTIAPGRQGVPVAGRIHAEYAGASDNLQVVDSFVTLPHTRLNVSGALGNRVSVTLNTTDLHDFSPLMGSNPPVALAGGQAAFSGALNGRLASPEINGHLAVDRFVVEGRQFDSLSGDVSASGSRAALSKGGLRRGAMQAQLSASVGLRDWNIAQNQPLSVQASVRNGDLADALALAGMSPAGYSGALTADANISGTVGNPRGTANFSVAQGTVGGEPVESLQAQVNLSDQLVTVQNAHAVAGASRIDLTAQFRHPGDRFDRGQLQAHIASSQIDLAQLRTVAEPAAEFRRSPAGERRRRRRVARHLPTDQRDRGCLRARPPRGGPELR